MKLEQKWFFIVLRGFSGQKLIERPMNNIYLILNSLCVNFFIQIIPPIILRSLGTRRSPNQEEIIHLFNSVGSFVNSVQA